MNKDIIDLEIAKFESFYNDSGNSLRDKEKALNEVFKVINQIPVSDAELAIESAKKCAKIAPRLPILTEFGQLSVFVNKFGNLILQDD